MFISSFKLFTELLVANSNKKYQFAIGTYAWGNKWDPTNDWSLTDMLKVESNWTEIDSAQEAPNICVYSDGILVGGTEPDGTVPEVTTAEPKETTVSETAETTASVTKVTAETTKTTTKNEPSESSAGGTEPTLPGDATCDSAIDVRDVTLVNQYVVKMADLTEEGFANADVITDGKVDLKDLGQLKKYLIKVISEF